MTSRSLFRLATLGLLLVTAGACSAGRNSNRITPDEIRGVWKTDNAAYADRAMEILDDALVFDVGQGDFTVQVIRSIRVKEVPDGREYDIEYRQADGGIFNLTLTFRPADRTIVLNNQPRIVWRWTGQTAY